MKEKILIIGVSHGLLKKKIEDDQDEEEESRYNVVFTHPIGVFYSCVLC